MSTIVRCRCLVVRACLLQSAFVRIRSAKPAWMRWCWRWWRCLCRCAVIIACVCYAPVQTVGGGVEAATTAAWPTVPTGEGGWLAMWGCRGSRRCRRTLIYQSVNPIPTIHPADSTTRTGIRPLCTAGQPKMRCPKNSVLLAER